MIRLSVFYPTTEGATFDYDYYRDKHVPLAVKTWGLERRRDRQGRRTAPTSPRSTSSSSRSTPWPRRWAAEGTADVMADMANYTTITPVVQTSEIEG